MPQKIHYRDDLFLLSTLVKTLEVSLSIEADPEYYRDKVVGDLFFIDATIRSLAENLIQNSHLSARAEYLKLLERVSSDFWRALERLQTGESPSAENYSAIAPQVKSLVSGQRSISQNLRSLIDESLSSDSVDTDLVSGDEISRLLGE